MKERRSSLDDINYRFRTVLNKLGIPDDKQGKMQNLALDLKMDVINSLDKECIKENNIRIFLDLLKHRNSLLNILSLKSIMLEGKDIYFEIFMKSNGIRILEDLTYKILFENERYNTPNKALYEKNHHENIKEIGLKWSDRNFNVEYDFQMYYAVGKDKNISDKDMSENSREYMLNEVLGCILTITQKYRCFEFDIAMIVRNSYLFVYTRNFYELIDFYAEHQIEKLDFLFKSDKIHLCYINTYFYDIYKENSKFKAVNKFLLHARYRNITQFILNEIRNENKKRPFNIRPGLSEKTFNNVSEYNSSSVKQDQKRTEIMGERIENTTTCTSSQLLDVRKSGNMLDDLRAETLTKLGAILKDLENEMLINLIPCYLQAFIADPETFKTKNNTAELTKEIERLKIDNERLRLAVVNMENKHSPIPVTKKVEEKRFDAEQKTIEVAVEEKLNNMTIKPKKMPFKRKTAAKTTNVYMTPYSKKTYYPLRWSKCTKSGNIWEDVNNAMKYENLTQIFTPDDLFCYEKKLAAVNKQGKTVSKVRTIFSSKKGQAISIALGRVKMTDQEIKVFIFQLNESKLGENMIRQLLKNYPKKDEFELLRALKMEIDLKHEIVGRAEQFYFEFIFCQQELYTYLAAIYFKLTYPSNAETIREMINKLTRIYTRALESKAIKEFCQYALFLGNVFNNNTFSGNAEGFNFESITAIIDYKGNNKEKLLDDITNKMQYDIIADLKLLTAENIKYDGLCIQFSDVVADYDMIVQTEEIKKYLMPLIKDFEGLKDTYKELNTLYAKFNKYYNGENIFESFAILLNELQKKK